jgi:hypothetical protein
MQSAGREAVRLGGVAIVAAGLAAALALVFLPLRLVPVSGGIVGFCGPGLRSDNALQVRLDPGIVNTGAAGPPAPPAEQRRLEGLCAREADGRLAAAGLVTVVTLLVGLPLIVVGGRQSFRPGPAGQAGAGGTTTTMVKDTGSGPSLR